MPRTAAHTLRSHTFPITWQQWKNWLTIKPDEQVVGKSYTPQDNVVSRACWELITGVAYDRDTAYSLRRPVDRTFLVGTLFSDIKGNMCPTPDEFKQLLELIDGNERKIFTYTAGEVKELV